MTTHFTLAKITQDQQVVTFLFNHYWNIEDIELLNSLIFNLLTEYEVIEWINGADRVNIRFLWQQSMFILNFDVYSQSCWLEPESRQDQELLLCVYKTLQKNGSF